MKKYILLTIASLLPILLFARELTLIQKYRYNSGEYIINNVYYEVKNHYIYAFYDEIATIHYKVSFDKKELIEVSEKDIPYEIKRRTVENKQYAIYKQ